MCVDFCLTRYCDTPWRYQRLKRWIIYHYTDVIMGVMTFQITSLTIVYSNVYSGADQRKHQSSASLAFVVTGDKWIPRTKGQWRGKCFHLMTSPCADVNSLAPGRCGRNFECIISKPIMQTSRFGTCCDIAPTWIPKNLTKKESTLVPVMAWCHRCKETPYDVTRQQH